MTADYQCRGCWALGNNCGLCPTCVDTRPPAPPLVTLMLATNDRRGNDDGYIRGVVIHLADAFAEFEGPSLQHRWCGDEERVTFKGRYKAAPHMLKLYGRGRLPVWRRDRHVGTMHWDRVGIEARYVAWLVRWLAMSQWLITAAPTRVHDAFTDLNVFETDTETYLAAIAAAMGVS